MSNMVEEATEKPVTGTVPAVSRLGMCQGGRIVVGVDGSESSKDALLWAANQAKLTGETLDIVMSWEIPAIPYGVWAGYDAGAQAEETLTEIVTEVLGAAEGPQHMLRTAEGPPALTLLEAAKGADLLVVGSRGRGPFLGMLLGSVSEHCIAHATCPVVVVRHCRTAA